MKALFTSLVFLFCSMILFGQTDPIEKIEVEPDPLIITAFDYATGKMNDVPWMFKASGGESFRFGYEHKMGKSFSLNFDTNWNPIFWASGNIDIEHNVELGIRKYLGQANKIRLNQQGNNLNGKYIEAGVQVNFENFSYNFTTPYFNIGYQTRFLKRGMMDAAFKFSYGDSSFSLNGQALKSFNVRTSIDIGFVLSPDYKLDRVEENKCAILKCYDEQSMMFKTRFTYLLNLKVSKSVRHISINPNFEFEHKISKVGLSLNHEIYYNYFYRHWIDSPVSYERERSNLGFRSSLRWYILKKRRIAKGKTANNLSGFYVGPLVGVTSINNVSDIPHAFYSEDGWRIQYGVDFGYQTRLMKNLYFKANISLLHSQYNLSGTKYSFTNFSDPSGIVVGYVF